MRKKARIGKVILGQEGKLFILEEGTRKIYQCNPCTVGGNIFSLHPDTKEDPGLLEDEIVRFTSDGHDTVFTVSALEFCKSVCEKCIPDWITLTLDLCACGNEKNSAYQHCLVCAIKQNRCARCAKPMT